MLRDCDSLKALEIIQIWQCGQCKNVPNVDDLLFCHFPSRPWCMFDYPKLGALLNLSIQLPTVIG